MATSRIDLNVANYVRINIGYNPLIIEAINGDVHVVLNKNQPSFDNDAFHKLTDRQRLEFNKVDTNVWALAKSSNTRAVVSELSNASPSNGDLVTDAWGVQKISTPISLFHGLWSFDISPSMWFTFHGALQVYDVSTNISSVDGMANIKADVVNPIVRLESREAPRYQPNRGHLYSDSGFIINPDGGIVRHGVFTCNLDGDIENGVFFEHRPDGTLHAVLVSGGITRTSLLIDTSILTGYGSTMNNIYDIQYQWRSAGNYKFFIGDPATGASRIVTIIDYLGTLTRASMENPALPAVAWVQRITSDIEWNWGCVDITAENGITDKEQYGSAFVENRPTGTDLPIIAMHNPLTIGGKVNTRTGTLARITVNSTKKMTFRVYMTRDPLAVIGGLFSASPSSHFMESNITATSVNLSLLQPVTIISVESNVSKSIDNPFRGRIEFPIVRGDYIVVTSSAGASAADVVIEYGTQL